MNRYIEIYEEAESYTRLVVGSFQKRKFDTKFLAGLVTMAFEKYMVSSNPFCQRKGV